MHVQPLMRSSLESEHVDLHTVDPRRDSLTRRFVARLGNHWKSLSGTARDNLEAVVWNAVTCLSQHEHTVLQSQRCVPVATRSPTPNIPAMCAMPHITRGSGVLSSKALFLFFGEHCHTCLTERRESGHVGWNVLIKNTCGFFFVVTINQRRPCLTPWRAQTAVKPSFELKAIWRDVLTWAWRVYKDYITWL